MVSARFCVATPPKREFLLIAMVCHGKRKRSEIPIFVKRREYRQAVLSNDVRSTADAEFIIKIEQHRKPTGGDG